MRLTWKLKLNLNYLEPSDGIEELRERCDARKSRQYLDTRMTSSFNETYLGGKQSELLEPNGQARNSSIPSLGSK